MIAQRILNGLDVSPLLGQIACTDLWNRDDCWIKPGADYRPDNIPLYYAGHEKQGFRELTAARNLIDQLYQAVAGKQLGKVVGITRMKPGEVLAPHVDSAMKPPQFERYQIPLAVPVGVEFMIDGEMVDMRPGEAWWFDKTVLHGVANHSREDRLALVVEIRC